MRWTDWSVGGRYGEDSEDDRERWNVNADSVPVDPAASSLSAGNEVVVNPKRQEGGANLQGSQGGDQLAEKFPNLRNDLFFLHHLKNLIEVNGTETQVIHKCSPHSYVSWPMKWLN